MATVSTRSDGIETRRRLLSAAADIFSVKGYSDTKITDICKKAEANVAAVSYHFGSKENLYVEAWRNAFQASIKAFPPDGGVPDSASTEERLRGRILSLLHRIIDPRSMEFDIARKEMANPTGLLAEVMKRSIDPLRRSFAELVRQIIGRAAPDQMVQLCVMSIHAQCFTRVLHERRRMGSRRRARHAGLSLDLDLNRLAEHILRFSVAGIRAVSDPGKRTAVEKRRQKRDTR